MRESQSKITHSRIRLVKLQITEQNILDGMENMLKSFKDTKETLKSR